MMGDSLGSVASLIKRMSRRLVTLANTQLKPMNIPHGYTTFLLCLYDQDGQTQSQLHKTIGIEQPTAVRTIDRMVRDGFITRRPSSTDRRVIHLFLTRKAKKHQDDLMVCLGFINDVALTGFKTAEKKQLQGYLERINHNVDGYLRDM